MAPGHSKIPWRVLSVILIKITIWLFACVCPQIDTAFIVQVIFCDVTVPHQLRNSVEFDSQLVYFVKVFIVKF